MSTENPVGSNFIGLDALASICSSFLLRVFDGGDVAIAKGEASRVNLAAEVLPEVGLTLRSETDAAAWTEAATAAELDVESLRVIAVAEDAFLKERAVLLSKPPLLLERDEQLAVYRGRRARAMQNAIDGFTLDVAVVLASERDPSPGHPFRLGTKLASQAFQVAPFRDAGGINPLPLTDEVLATNSLNAKTLVFVGVEGSLIEADTFDDAVTVYVNEDLLRTLSGRRSGPEYTFVGTTIAISALQQLAMQLAADLSASHSAEFDWEDGQRPVLDFVYEKAVTCTPGLMSNPNHEGFIRMLRDEPLNIVASLSSLERHTTHAIRLVAGPGEDE